MRLILPMFIAAAIGLSAAAAHARTEYLPYEGKDAIHEGQGGEKKAVDGIDFWFDGAPPRRFQVLGVITDRRRESGLIGAIRMHNLDPDIAKLALKAGGDAVIVDNRQEDVVGVSSFGNSYVWGQSSGSITGNSFSGSGWGSGFHSGFSRAVKDLNSRYVVVRYLPNGQGEVAAPAQSATLNHAPSLVPPTPPAASPPSSIQTAPPTSPDSH